MARALRSFRLIVSAARKAVLANTDQPMAKTLRQKWKRNAVTDLPLLNMYRENSWNRAAITSGSRQYPIKSVRD